MPTIAEQVSKNAARIAAGGETGTGVGPQQAAPTVHMAPLQDLPAGGGLPQRGMFPADLTLNSDRSDSNRAFRGAGMRSSTFPFAPTSISSTIVEKVQSGTSSGGSSSSTNLTAGPGISITASGKNFTVSGQIGTMQMPNIFAVTGSMPVTAFPNGGPITVSLVDQKAATFFAGPILPVAGGESVVDQHVTVDPASTASLTVGPLVPSQSGEFAILIANTHGNTETSGPSGWTQEPGVNLNSQGVIFSQTLANEPSISPVINYNTAGTLAGALATFFVTPGTVPTIVNTYKTGSALNVGANTVVLSPTVKGNTLVFIGLSYGFDIGSTFSGLADGGGDVFTAVMSQRAVDGTGLVVMFAASNIVAGTTSLTFNFSGGTTSARYCVYEVSNLTPGNSPPSFRTIINTDLNGAVFGASGTDHNAGAVPDPGNSAGSTRFLNEDATWMTAVTSLGVSLTVPSIFGSSVSGSPVTTSGTIGLTLTLVNQNANLVFAGPTSGGAAGPTFRALVNADFPTSGVSAGSYTSANITVNAQGIVTSAANGSGGGGSGGATVKTANYLAVSGDSGTMLAFNTSGGGTPALVQTATGSTTTATFATAPTTNHLIIVTTASTTSTAPSLSGGPCSAYTKAAGPIDRDDGYYITMFYGVVNQTGTIITASGLGSFPSTSAYEFSNCATSSPLDVDSTVTGGTSTTIGSPVTTTLSGDLIFCFAFDKNGPSTFTTGGGGFTYSPASGSSNNWIMYGAVGSAGTYEPTVTFAAALGWACITAAFKPLAGLSLTLTLPSSPPSSTWNIWVNNWGIGTLAVNPNGLNLNGSSSNITLNQNQGVYITTDGTNYFYS